MAIPIIGQTDPREKKIIVFSHERSGTHFLMNTIGENFGYNNLQWIDIDFIPLNMWPATIFTLISVFFLTTNLFFWWVMMNTGPKRYETV